MAKGENNTHTAYFSALVKMWSSLKSELVDLLQSKMSSETSNMINKYKIYKDNYVKNIMFDPSVPELSMCISIDSKY